MNNGLAGIGIAIMLFGFALVLAASALDECGSDMGGKYDPVVLSPTPKEAP